MLTTGSIGSNEHLLRRDDPFTEPLLESLHFQFPLRKYQQQILELVDKKLASGERRMHLVAPPGAGKTIIGLQIISQLKRPSLVLCPNTTIQSQWGQKVDLFLPPEQSDFGTSDIIGTHEDKPLKPITLLTYQVLSTPGREQEYLEKLAHDAWVAELTQGRSIGFGEAELRILDLLRNNPKAHQKEMSRHVSRLRRRLSELLDLKDVLHANALHLLQSMRRQKFGVVIFDECHHLTDYWAAIMTHLVKVLDDPIIIGLTGTPPEGKTSSQETRYMSLVGEIDYQVPTPALVKEGGLAPYQDLVFFTEPTDKELMFLEEQHDKFHVLIDELTKPVAVPIELVPTGTAEQFNGVVAQLRPSDARQFYNEPNGQSEPLEFVGGTLESGALAPEAYHSALSIWVRDRVFSSVQKDVVRFNRIAAGAVVGAHAGAVGKSAAQGYGRNDTAITVRTSVRYTARNCSRDDAKSDSGKNTESGSQRHLKTDRKTGQKFDPGTNLNTPGNGAAGQAARAASSVKTQIVCPGGWTELMRTQSELAQALCRYLWKVKIRLPRNIEVSESLLQSPTVDDWMRILDDYATHKLKVSADPESHRLYERIRSAARNLGYGFTEQGLRKQASPVDRVLAFSNSKPQAVTSILDIEYKVLQDRLRAVVVTDFERMSATSVKALKGVLNEESGGAVACLKTLLQHEVSAYVNPCLVTGSLLLIDKRVVDQFVCAADEYLNSNSVDISLQVASDAGLPYCEISSNSGLWQSKLYVGLCTAIFERGITKCLIGTRGLFGEGWDSQALNTLVDLTTTTSPVSVKQLRGRSIRIQTNDPLGARKVANNWDVVCIAPQLEKGLNDYHRFARKHDCFFGISNDGHIERGVGHVHPSFSELTPVEVFACFERFNDEMIHRSLLRERIYELWKVGQPYRNRTLGCVELFNLRKLALTPPHIRTNLNYKAHARELRAAFIGVWTDYGALGLALALVMFMIGAGAFAPYIGTLALVCSVALGWRRANWLFDKMRGQMCRPNTQDASLYDVGTAVLTALQRRKFIPLSVMREQIKISTRVDGTYRVFLDGIEPEQSEIFIESFKEVMTPVIGQPFLIPKYEYFVGGPGEPLSGLDGFVEPPADLIYEKKEREFFKKYLAGRAQARIAGYHPVPSLLARSKNGRDAFEAAWNKYVSPGSIIATESKPEVVDRYFALGPSLSHRVLWE